VNAGGVLQQPLGNARLELSGPRTSMVTRTNAAGRFAFANLPPGRYRVQVTRDGFIPQTSPPIVLARGQHINDVVLNFQPAPTLFGAVLDAYGQPKPTVIVEALRMGYGVRGGRVLTALASTLPDDYGRYRLYWLDPGEYKIVGQNSPPTHYPGLQIPGKRKPSVSKAPAKSRTTPVRITARNHCPAGIIFTSTVSLEDSVTCTGLP